MLFWLKLHSSALWVKTSDALHRHPMFILFIFAWVCTFVHEEIPWNCMTVLWMKMKVLQSLNAVKWWSREVVHHFWVDCPFKRTDATLHLHAGSFTVRVAGLMTTCLVSVQVVLSPNIDQSRRGARTKKREKKPPAHTCAGKIIAFENVFSPLALFCGLKKLEF